MTGPPAMVMPVDPQAEQMATLQGSKHISVLPFLSAEALQRQAAVRKQQQQHLQTHGDSDADPSPIQQPTPLPSVNAQPDRQTASGSIPQTQMLHSLPRRPNNTRTNILDYLSWLNLMTRIAAAKQLTASTKQAEVQSKAFTAEHKPSVPESYASARSPSTKPALDDSEITDLLKTLPGALESRMNNSGASDIVARATGIERIVLSMLGVDAPELQAVQKENLPFSGLSRHRYNLSTLANEIFGEASSLPTYSRPNISKSSHKTVSLHPSVALVDLPRAILPLVGVSTIPQSILGMTGSSGVPLALLQLKFGGGSDDQFSSEASASSSTSRLAALPESLPHLQLDQSDGSTLPRNPHHDYRIRHTASVHHRAKQIYAKGLSKDTSVDPWCARHRVQACGVCHAAEVEAKKSLRGRKSQDAPVVPGDGLAYFKDDILLQSGRRRPLASSLPDFLMVASDVFAVMSLGSEEVYERHVQAQDKIEFTPLSSFYDLVVDYITQAVLEGYTLHGWTGKEALEVLFSVGTGTWEERKWAEAPSSWTTPANSVPASCMPSRAGSPSLRPISRDDSIPVTFESTVSGSSTPESDDSQVSLDDDSEDEQDSRLHLIKSATNLFRTRTPAQADFEREMRDRLHEFLDVPDDVTLEDHLCKLGTKYPLSMFEERLIAFFMASEALLGKPVLVKNALKAEKSQTGQSTTLESRTLDFAPLEQYASRFTWEEIERATGPSFNKRSTTPPISTAQGKKRKI